MWELGFSLQDILTHAAPPVRIVATEYFELGIAATTVAALARWGLRSEPIWKNLLFSFASGIVTILVVVLALSQSIGLGTAQAELRSLDEIYFPDEGAGRLHDFFQENQPDKIAHLATTAETYFLIGSYVGRTDRWVIRLQRDGAYASFVYQDRH